jgi:hypothetical protein
MKLEETIELEEPTVSHSKILDLSNRPNLDYSSLEGQVYPNELYLNQSQLTTVPNSFLSSIENCLKTLKLCRNQLTKFPNVSLPQLQVRHVRHSLYCRHWM